MPKVSFVITVFNKAPYLPQVIQALQRQQGDFEREFIFVNDGSTDESLDVLQQALQDWPQARILNQLNAGPVAATNAGIAAAKGEFVKFCDGDDILLPDTTRLMLQAAQISEAPVVFCGMYLPKIQVGSLAAQIPAQIAEFAGRALSSCRQIALDAPTVPELEAAPYIGSFERALAALAWPVSLCRIKDARHFMLYSCRCPCGNTSSLVRRDWLLKVKGCDEQLWMLQDLSLSFRLAFSGARFVALHGMGAYSLTFPGSDCHKVSQHIWQERYENCRIRSACLLQHQDISVSHANKMLNSIVSRILEIKDRKPLYLKWIKWRTKYPLLFWKSKRKIIQNLYQLSGYCLTEATIKNKR